MADFSNLEAGDKVIWHGEFRDTVEIIEKVTPTGRIKVKIFLINFVKCT